jgi:hypothetical protein
MAEKFKKINKEFKLSDSTVNSYGFRLLTAGYLLSEFAKNPIGYYMHQRDNGVLVKWDNLRVQGDDVFGTPCINLSHPRGQQTVDEIENGFLNAASFGHFNVLETSDEKVAGQTGVTVTKWYNRECSLVDVPGNFNSLTKLYDKDNNEINLADFTNTNLKNMKQVILTAAQLSLLNLKAESTQVEVDTIINDLIAKANKVDGLTNDLAAANTAKATAEKALKDLKAATTEKEVKDLIAKGIADKKLTAALGATFEKDYAGNATGLKAVIEAMPVYVSLTAQLSGDDNFKKLAAKSWDELDKTGELAELKAKDFELYKQKFKEAFNSEYKG